MGINFLEIFFTINVIAILILWVWFIILGFRANKAWGFSIVFLTPITPFMFASRFARKARRAIYYHVVSWFIFIFLIIYIQFSSVDFYKIFFWKIAPESLITLINNKPVEEIKIPVIENQEIKVEVFDNVVEEKPIEIKPDIKPEIKPDVKLDVKPKFKKRSYKVVNMSDMQLYIGEKVIITTSTKKHKGRLLSASSSVLKIKKRIAGGSTSMPIRRSRIKKVEVYLR